MSIDIPQLLAESARFRHASTHAETTIRNYAADWKLFIAWCDAAGRPSLPASAETTELYLAAVIHSGRKIATAARHSAAVNHYHLANGHLNPGRDVCRAMLAGAQRLQCERPSQKIALTVEDLRRISLALPDTAAGVRNRAILTLGFASALRRSNLSALQVADLAVVPEGLVIQVRKEKQDQRGEGRAVGIARGQHPESCAVLAVAAWLAVRGDTPGALFVRIANGRVTAKPLHPRVIALVVKEGATLGGLDSRGYSGHKAE